MSCLERKTLTLSRHHGKSLDKRIPLISDVQAAVPRREKSTDDSASDRVHGQSSKCFEVLRAATQKETVRGVAASRDHQQVGGLDAFLCLCNQRQTEIKHFSERRVGVQGFGWVHDP